MNAVSQAVKQIMDASPFTRRQIAAKLGIHESNLTRWTHPQYDAHCMPTLRKLGDALGYTVHVEFKPIRASGKDGFDAIQHLPQRIHEILRAFGITGADAVGALHEFRVVHPGQLNAQYLLEHVTPQAVQDFSALYEVNSHWLEGDDAPKFQYTHVGWSVFEFVRRCTELVEADQLRRVLVLSDRNLTEYEPTHDRRRRHDPPKLRFVVEKPHPTLNDHRVYESWPETLYDDYNVDVRSLMLSLERLAHRAEITASGVDLGAITLDQLSSGGVTIPEVLRHKASGWNLRRAVENTEKSLVQNRVVDPDFMNGNQERAALLILVDGVRIPKVVHVHADHRQAIRTLCDERDSGLRFEAALQWAYAITNVNPQRPYASVTALHSAVLLAHLIADLGVTDLTTGIGSDPCQVLGTWLRDTTVFISKLRAIPESRRQLGFDGIIAVEHIHVSSLWRGVCNALETGN
jgi:hypothetical protein